ncbi:MAG: hypothetical protein CVU46_00080 [Chloroflexi bacterium HGW-Chloroflexi-8]|nr:MAG: hypothetical protein CVU46_00080 [Chloroflexi bacterium HGW-Chloroflexi-8]
MIMTHQLIAQYIHWQPHLNALFSALEAAEIPFLVLKGWAFIPDLYPDPSIGRPLGDVDLLVQPQKFSKAVRLILNLGYQPGSKHSNYGYDRKSSYTPKELAFYNAAGVSIDLHSHIFPTFWSQAAYPMDMDVVWESRQLFTDWGGNSLERLSAELNFLHLITHIVRHGLLDMNQNSYRDLVRLLEKYGSVLDWVQIRKLVVDWRLQSAFFFVRRTCEKGFQIQFPAALKDDWQPGSLRLWFVDRILTPLWNLHPGGEHWLLKSLLTLALVDQPGQAFGLVWDVLFPTDEARYHLHGYSLSLFRHYQVLLSRSFGWKRKELWPLTPPMGD